MMVSKIITHTASVVAQNKKDRVRVLGRGTHLKSKRHFSPASPSGSSTNVSATRLERRSKTVQSNCTQSYVAQFQKNHHGLLLGNWNDLTLLRKELELVEEAKKHQLDIVGVSSTRKRSSAIVDLDGRWKFFYSSADSSMLAQAGLRILKPSVVKLCV